MQQIKRLKVNKLLLLLKKPTNQYKIFKISAIIVKLAKMRQN